MEINIFEGYTDEKHWSEYKAWEKRIAKLWQEAQQRHDGKLDIRAKRSMLWLWGTAKILLNLVTFGRGIDVLDGRFYSTMGKTIWCPGDGSAYSKLHLKIRYRLLAHELAHIDTVYFFDPDAQDKPDIFRSPVRILLGKINRWLIQPVGYMLLPLPYYFAYYRQWFEYHGYKRSLLGHLIETGGLCKDYYRTHLINCFSDWSYGRMATKKRAEELVDRMITEMKEKYSKGNLC